MTIEHDLKNLTLFRGLTSDLLKEIVRMGRMEEIPANTVIYQENDPASIFYLLMKGSARLSVSNEKGREADLIHFEAGDWFGEVELIDGRPRKMRATTTSICQFFLLTRLEFLSLLSKSSLFLSRVLQKLSAKIQQRSDLVGELRFEEEQLRTQAEIQRHRSISQMVAGVAHEINTPLGIISNAASLLSEKLTPTTIPALAKDATAEAVLHDLSQAASLIQSHATRSARLVESFKKLSTRHVTSRKEVVDFGVLTKEALGLYQLEARKSHLQLEMRDELGKADRTWEGFPGYYTQVILNLLANIDRYAYPKGGGGAVMVTVSQESLLGKSPQFRVAVQDYGCGIPKKNLAKVFDAFFTTGRDIGGTGLGLAIVHNLVTSALQGTISISSEPGKGTRVEMYLPKIILEAPQETIETTK